MYCQYYCLVFRVFVITKIYCTPIPYSMHGTLVNPEPKPQTVHEPDGAGPKWPFESPDSSCLFKATAQWILTPGAGVSDVAWVFGCRLG